MRDSDFVVFYVDFYNIMNMFEVSVYAQRWVESGGKCSIGAQEAIIAQNEYLLNKLRTMSVNHVGEL